jgi:hypothetical protein
MQPIAIEIVEVFDKASGSLRIFHLSPLADANSPFEWWISEDGLHHALFHQEAYYDDVLRQRRESGNMICSKDQTKRLVLIGNIFRQIDLDPNTFIELSRNAVQLHSISVDQK